MFVIWHQGIFWKESKKSVNARKAKYISVQCCWWVEDGEITTSAIFWGCFCSAVKSLSKQTEAWINIFLGIRSALLRAALLSVCQRGLRLALTRHGSVDRLGWQQGDQLVCPRCQQHLTLPSQFVTAPNSLVTNTWGEKLLMLCTVSVCLLCARCFLFFLEFIKSVCVCLRSTKSVFSSVLHNSCSFLLPAFILS